MRWLTLLSRLRRPTLLGWALITVACLLPLAVAADPYNLVELRHLYAAAAKEEAAEDRFLTLMRGYRGAEPAVLAYRGAAEACRARYVWSPLTKLQAVRAAQAWFGQAAEAAPTNVEIRFLRYTIEVNVPRYLGLSAHLDDDRSLIMLGARHARDYGLDAQSLRLIRDFMLLHGHCTPAEERMLRNINP